MLGATLKKAGSKDQFRKVDLGYALKAGELEDALRDLDYPYLSIYHPSLLLGDRKEHRTAASAMVNEACSLASEPVAEPVVHTREYEDIVRLA